MGSAGQVDYGWQLSVCMITPCLFDLSCGFKPISCIVQVLICTRFHKLYLYFTRFYHVIPSHVTQRSPGLHLSLVGSRPWPLHSSLLVIVDVPLMQL